MPFKRLLLILLFFVTTTTIAQEKHTYPRYKIGYNLFTLIGNTNEFIFERTISNQFVAVLNLGNTFAPTRGYFKLDDGVELEKMSGQFFKIGSRYILHNQPKESLAIGLLMIGSSYQESGKREYVTTDLNSSEQSVSANGFLMGVAIDLKLDVKIYKSISLRYGYQFGFYNRNDHLGSSRLTYQPGFGARSLFIPLSITSQTTIGIIFNLGTKQTH